MYTVTQEDMRWILETFSDKGLSEKFVADMFQQNIDDAVIGALKEMAGKEMPNLDVAEFRNPLVLGSGNAFATARILFRQTRGAIFGDESNYEDQYSKYQSDTHGFTYMLREILDRIFPSIGINTGIDGVYVFSASGSKDSGRMVDYFTQSTSLPVRLVTCTHDSEAASYLRAEDRDRTVVTPKLPEMITYNVSTYMGWLLAQTQEDPGDILRFIHEEVAPSIPDNIGEFASYCFLLPADLFDINTMYATKFHEILVPKAHSRAFTMPAMTHATSINTDETELFVGIGVQNDRWGVTPSNRYNVPVPENVGFAGMMAIGYFVIGKIQGAKEPFFKQNVVRYCQEEYQKSFGKPFCPIVI